jgi:prepilin-type N-terminal cleavage/methylation domain-containing protein
MIKQKGFTLIELMVVIAILMIVGTIVLGAIGASNGNSNVSIGINGMTESRCIEGYKFIIDQEGRTRQILDEFGKGVRCESINFGKPGAFGRM